MYYWGQDIIQIGCQQKSIKEWQKEFIEIGKENNYSEEEIKEYKNYIDIVAIMHEKKEGQ